MRLLLLDVVVESHDGRPARIRYRERPRGSERPREREHRVRRQLDSWRYGGRWWRGESGRSYYLLELDGTTAQGRSSAGCSTVVAELYRQDLPERWVLSRLGD